MKYAITSIDAVSAGKIYGLLMGLFSAIVFVPIGLIVAAVSGKPATGLWVLIMPVLYAICGFVVGLISAVIFSFAASKVGGLVVEVSEMGKKKGK